MLKYFQKNFHWKKNYEKKNLLDAEIVLLKIGGHLAVNYENYLPKSLSFLSVILNAVWMFHAAFSNFHMIILYLTQLFIHLQNDGTVTQISDALMSTILHFYAFSAGLFMTVYYKRCLNICDFINKNFKRRSAPGEFLIQCFVFYEY